jgi:hypothetical protein
VAIASLYLNSLVCGCFSNEVVICEDSVSESGDIDSDKMYQHLFLKTTVSHLPSFQYRYIVDLSNVYVLCIRGRRPGGDCIGTLLFKTRRVVDCFLCYLFSMEISMLWVLPGRGGGGVQKSWQ